MRPYAGEAPAVAVEDNVIEATEQEWDESVEQTVPESIPDDTDYSAFAPAHDDLSYAYSTLNDAEKTLYDEVYRAIVSYTDPAPVSTTEPKVLDKVFNCVMIDHPEIFYVNGYRYTKYTIGNTIKRIGFGASYVYSEQERDAIWPDIDAVAEGILMNVYSGASDYDKIKFIYDTLVLQTEYDLNSPDNQNVISVLLNKRSVCQGYAKTMQLLLNRLGIPCSLATGYVSGGERHAWNIVKADGDWYYADATWGDASYILDEDSEVDAIIPDVNYDYLLVPYNEISLTHRLETVVPMPECNSLNDNYYVKEGLYFTGYDTDKLGQVFSDALSRGDGYVTIKCSDDAVYRRMYEELVNNQHIFDYLSGRDVAYSYNDDGRKLLFALR